MVTSSVEFECNKIMLSSGNPCHDHCWDIFSRNDLGEGNMGILEMRGVLKFVNFLF